MEIIHSSYIQIAAKWITFIYGLVFHEYAHALTAVCLGDSTPREQGRLTLNPLVHVDPIGLFSLVIFGIGWAKPVVFNPTYFRHPRWYSVLVAIAGPISNFLLALMCMYLIRYVYIPYVGESLSMVSDMCRSLLESGVSINIFLGVFNMLPVAPFDGSHLLLAVMPEDWKATYRQYSYFLCILILFFGWVALDHLLSYGTFHAFNLLLKLVI